MEHEPTDTEFLLSLIEYLQSLTQYGFPEGNIEHLQEIANKQVPQLIMLQVNNAVFYILDDIDNTQKCVDSWNGDLGDSEVSMLTLPVTCHQIDLSDLDEIGNCHVIQGVSLTRDHLFGPIIPPEESRPVGDDN